MGKEQLSSSLQTAEDLLRTKDMDLYSARKETALSEGNMAILQQALNEAGTQVSILEARLKDEEGKTQSLERLLTDLRMHEARTSDHQDEQAAELEKLKHSIEELRSDREGVVARERAAYSQLQDLTAQFERFKSEHQTLHQKWQDQSVQHQRLQARNAELQQKVDAQASLIATMDPLFKG